MGLTKDYNFRSFLIKNVDNLLLRLVIITTVFFVDLVFIILAIMYSWQWLIGCIAVFLFNKIFPFLRGKNKKQLYEDYKNSSDYNPIFSVDILEEHEDGLDDYFTDNYYNASNTSFLFNILFYITLIVGITLIFFVSWWWIVLITSIYCFITGGIIEKLYTESIYSDYLKTLIK